MSLAFDVAASLRRAADVVDAGGTRDDLLQLVELARLGASTLEIKQQQHDVHAQMIGGLAAIIMEIPLPHDLPSVVRLREIMARVRMTVVKPEGTPQ